MSAVQDLGGQGAPVVDEFEVWLGERNRWLQTAAKNLIETKRTPTDPEIVELARLCMIESKKADDPGFGVVTPGSLALAANRPAIRIDGISEVYGLNAVKAGAALSFGAGNITVFYGQNGSGKSGYARLLKQACGSRSKDEIHPNVFLEEPVPCRAHFQLSVGGQAGKIEWTLTDGAHPKLRHVQIFDSRTATQYMGKNEASYEPSQMKFVAALIAISDRVSQHLGTAKNALVSSLPQFPLDLGITEENKWLAALKPATTTAAIDKDDFCEAHQELARKVNVGLTQALADLCDEVGAKMVFCSTDTVFDGEHAPYREQDEPGPLNFYAHTKVEAEKIVARLSEKFVVARLALVVGLPILGAGNSFLARMMAQLKQGREVKVPANKVRTPIDVITLGGALLELAEKNLSGIFHLAGNDALNRLDMTRRIATRLGFSERLIVAMPPDADASSAPRPRDVSLDNSKARTHLGTPMRGFDEALDLIVRTAEHPAS